MQEITLIIGKDGKVNLDVSGVEGAACSELTKSIEKALGKVEKVKRKSEFYNEQGVGSSQKVGY